MRSILRTLKGIITEPNKFFQAVKKEKTIKQAFMFYLVFFVIDLALFTLAFYFGEAASIYAQIPFYSFPMIIATMVIGLAVMFLVILIFHGFFKLLRGKGSYADTFKTYVYAMAPGLVFGIFYYLVLFFVDIVQNPAVNFVLGMVNFIFMIWMAVLIVIGGSILHKISRGRAFLAGILLPAVVLFVLSLIIGIMVFMGVLMSGMGGF